MRSFRVPEVLRETGGGQPCLKVSRVPSKDGGSPYCERLPERTEQETGDEVLQQRLQLGRRLRGC